MNPLSEQSARQEAVETLRKLEPLFKRFGVVKVWLFGSRALGRSKADSDWDLMVEFPAPPGFDEFMGLRVNLEDQLNAPIDLLSRSACPPRFLQAIAGEMVHVA